MVTLRNKTRIPNYFQRCKKTKNAKHAKKTKKNRQRKVLKIRGGVTSDSTTMDVPKIREENLPKFDYINGEEAQSVFLDDVDNYPIKKKLKQTMINYDEFYQFANNNLMNILEEPEDKKYEGIIEFIPDNLKKFNKATLREKLQVLFKLIKHNDSNVNAKRYKIDKLDPQMSKMSDVIRKYVIRDYLFNTFTKDRIRNAHKTIKKKFERQIQILINNNIIRLNSESSFKKIKSPITEWKEDTFQGGRF
tara:strand:+ start:20 stop:763 length:744 start_codon:yes stop_codon:yes gene_type:complete